jgi:hypothetical protein
MTETTTLFKMILTDQWDEETWKVVGQIAIAFAQLEHILWLSPKRIEKLDFSVWEGMAGRRAIPQRCDQISEAYAIKRINQDGEAELKKLLEKVKRVNKKRNSIIHGRWGCKKRNGEVISRHRIWNNRDQGIDVAKLRQLRDHIRELRDQLGRYPW